MTPDENLLLFDVNLRAQYMRRAKGRRVILWTQMY